MMYYEFLDIVGATERAVSAHEYAAYIEPLYVADTETANKQEWCAKYAPGLIAAIPAIRALEIEKINTNAYLALIKVRVDEVIGEVTERMNQLIKQTS